MVKLNTDKQWVDKVRLALKDNEGYCPCKVIRSIDTKCMCKEFREQEEGYCHCGLYYKTKEND